MKVLRNIKYTCCSLLLMACGEGEVPFKEVQTGTYEVIVGSEVDSGTPKNSYPIEQSTETDTNTQTSPEDTAMIISAFLGSDGEDDASDAAASDEGGDDEGSGQESGGSQAGNSGSGSASDGSEGFADKDLVSLCSRIFSGAAQNIVVLAPNSPTQNVQLDEETVVAARLSGNQESLVMNIKGAGRIAGFCLIATGNQPYIDIGSSVDVGKLVLIAKGNQTNAHMSLLEGAQLEQSYIEMKGNSHSVTLEGVDSQHCSQAKVKGNGSSAQCL